MGIGSSLKKALKQVGGAAAVAAGTYYGGAAGGAAAASLGNAAGLDTTGLFGNLVNGAVGVGTDYLQSQYNLQQQMKLASYTAQEQNLLNEAAYQRNLQQWNLENAYNSPAEQMKRYEEAGLNKNLIYSQQNTAANSPTLQPATYDPGHYTPVDKSAQRQSLKLALLEHQQRITNQAIENDLARQRLVLSARSADREDALAKAQINAIAANIGLTDVKKGDIEFKQGHYVPPDRRGWVAKIADDVDYLFGIDPKSDSYKEAVNDYKNSWFHRVAGFFK